MKGLLVAASGTLALALAMTVVLRLARPRRRVASLLGVFAVSLPGVAAAYLLTPGDLWVLPGHLVDGRAWGLLFSLAVYASLFAGGLMQLYNLADRGFSLRILIDLDEDPRHPASVADVVRAYGGGQGMKWMLAKRIDGVVQEGLAESRAGRLVLTSRGRRAARVFAGVRSALRLPS